MLSKLAEYKIIPIAVAALLVIGLMLSRVFNQGGSEPSLTISAEEAKGYIGSRAEVCGAVAEVAHMRDIGGEPTFINLEAEHPNQPFTALIWGDNLHRWSITPEERYRGQYICVRGTIRSHEDTPQIVVSSPDQIIVQ